MRSAERAGVLLHMPRYLARRKVAHESAAPPRGVAPLRERQERDGRRTAKILKSQLEGWCVRHRRRQIWVAGRSVGRIWIVRRDFWMRRLWNRLFGPRRPRIGIIRNAASFQHRFTRRAPSAAFPSL